VAWRWERVVAPLLQVEIEAACTNVFDANSCTLISHLSVESNT
jgi:hypothetical protein